MINICIVFSIMFEVLFSDSFTFCPVGSVLVLSISSVQAEKCREEVEKREE